MKIRLATDEDGPRIGELARASGSGVAEWFAEIVFHGRSYGDLPLVSHCYRAAFFAMQRSKLTEPILS